VEGAVSVSDFIGFDVYKDNITADLANTAAGNDVFIITAKQPETFAWSWDDQA
jgi:hypothetical protein